MIIQFGEKEHLKMEETYRWAKDSIPRGSWIQQEIEDFHTSYGISCDDMAPERLQLDEETLARFHELTDEIISKNRYICDELTRIMDGCEGLVDYGAERRQIEELRKDMRRMQVFKNKVDEYADEMRHMDRWMEEMLSEYAKIWEENTISRNNLTVVPENYELEGGGAILEHYLRSLVNENEECIYGDNVDEIIAEIKTYCPWALTTLYATVCYDTSGYESALEKASRIANIAAQGRLERASKFIMHIETYVSNMEIMTNKNIDTEQPVNVEMLQYFARRLMWEGYEPAFVAGMLGNIIYGASFGEMESSAFDSCPETKPDYLQNMDEYLHYRDKGYSGNNIMRLGLDSVQKLLQEVIDFNNNHPDRNAKFGIGSIQWTEPVRVSVLIDCYIDVCGDNNFLTEEQCMEAECNCLIGELNGDYDALYHTRYGNIYLDWIETSGENINSKAVGDATEKIFNDYILHGTETLAVRESVANKIYEIMTIE